MAALESMLSPSEEQAQVSGEALLEALDAVFEADPDIDELGVLMLGPNADSAKAGCRRENAAKISARDAFILPEPHKLGIASWCLRALFQAAKSRFERFNDISCRSQVTSEQILSATRALLLLHPSSYTVWNARKATRKERFADKVSGGISHDLINSEIIREIAFVDLVFSKHPKIAEAWEHRKWCVRELVGSTSGSNKVDKSLHRKKQKEKTLIEFLSHEVEMCELIARRYPKNYYAWSHRQFVCVHFVSSSHLIDEMHRSQKWCERNVSDHSGFHHRQFLWMLLLDLSEICGSSEQPLHNAGGPQCLIERRKYVARIRGLESWPPKSFGLCSSVEEVFCNFHGEIDERLGSYLTRCHKSKDINTKLITAEFDWCRHLIDNYPGHESLWSHRRFLAYLWASIPTFVGSSKEWSLMSTEIQNCNSRLKDDGLALAESDRKFCGAYLDWMSRQNQFAKLTQSQQKKGWNRDQHPVHRWYLTASYLGRPFAGWQRQNDEQELAQASIQGSIETACKIVLSPSYEEEPSVINDIDSKLKIVPTKLNAWVMVNGERTDKGCNSMHHDFEIVVARASPQLFASLKEISDEILCRRINNYFEKQGESLKTLAKCHSAKPNALTREKSAHAKKHKKKSKKQNALALRGHSWDWDFSTEGRLPLYIFCPMYDEQKEDSDKIENEDSITRCKRYTYFLQQGPRDQTLAPYSWYVRQNLDVLAMRRALSFIEGWHDFSHFGGVRSTRNGKSGVRCLAHCSLVRLGDMIADDFRRIAQGGQHKELECKLDDWDLQTDPYSCCSDLDGELDSKTHLLAFTFVGNGFLHHMVRRIVSTLRQIGQGLRPVESIDLILSGNEETGAAAPARGLWRMGLEWAILPPAPTTLLSRMATSSKNEGTQGTTPTRRNSTTAATDSTGIAEDMLLAQSFSRVDMTVGAVVADSRQRGGHRVGNFPKYYDFNPVAERMKMLPDRVCDWSSCYKLCENERMGEYLSVLDLGCNAGDLSLQLFERIAAAGARNKIKTILVGVDVDENLIARAQEKAVEYSDVKFVAGDVCDPSLRSSLCALPREMSGGCDTEQNSALVGASARVYDITSCFGLTMWIHLNRGDSGLESFLRGIATMTSCTILIEIHPWKNYKSAVKRLRKISKDLVPPHWPHIELRGPGAPEETVHRILKDCGFTMVKELGSTHWGRCVRTYERK